MIEDFRVIISSDVDYEKLIAEIESKDGAICTISQERDDGKLEIEFTPMNDGQPAIVKCDLEDFKKILDIAVKKLKNE